jgi:predicted esterase
MVRPLWVGILMAGTAVATDLPVGRLIENVQCAGDPSNSYALYLPSHYTPQRSWPVIFGFDPRARGRLPVERYQAAAEKYGYIVAGSNNSQNGSWAMSMAAAKAMTVDVSSRFPIDNKRVYAAGMSGGARVALGIALGSDLFAGVIASSAGYPDSKPRKSLRFALFGTAGIEDFNYLEMRLLDRELTSAHRLAIFEGGHAWLSSDLAMEAVEWMEIQAMKSGRIQRNDAEVDAIFARRMLAIENKAEAERWLELESIRADFEGLKDVAGVLAQAAGLRADKRTREALRKDREEVDRERRLVEEMADLETKLTRESERTMALGLLRARWKNLSAAAKADAESPERRMARRVLRGFAAGAAGNRDAEYLKIVEAYRLPRAAQ